MSHVQQSKDAFIAVLTAMPDTVLLSEFDTKLADHDCIATRVALATAEIKSTEHGSTFSATMRDQHSRDLAVSQEYIQIIKHVRYWALKPRDSTITLPMQGKLSR